MSVGGLATVKPLLTTAMPYDLQWFQHDGVVELEPAEAMYRLPTYYTMARQIWLWTTRWTTITAGATRLGWCRLA